MSEEKVNGKIYPMWSQFIEKQDDFIGKTLEDWDMGVHGKTIIKGITLEPNGEDSAYFSIEGEDFNCGFDVKYGGLAGGEEGWINFSGYGGHSFRIESSHE